MKPSRRAWIALFVSGFLQLTAFFMLMPWLLYRLHGDGVSTLISGALAACGWVGILLITPLCGGLVQRLGRCHALWLAAILSTTAATGFAVTSRLEWWFAFVVLEGMASGLRWVLGEAMVMELAPPGQRGRCVGLYETMVGTTWFAGPLLLNALGTKNPLVPWWALGLMVAALVLTLAMGPLPRGDSGPAAGVGWRGVARAVARHPLMVVMGFVGGFLEAGVSAALPLYGLALGFDTQLSTWLVVASGLASAVVMLPTGWLADRLGRQVCSFTNARIRLMRWCCGLTLLLTLCAPWLSAAPWLALVLAFVWGGVGGCLNTLAVIDIGERDTGAGLFHATSSLVLAYTLGAIAGPLLGAMALQHGPALGFPALLLAVCAAGCWALRPLSRSDRGALTAFPTP